MHIIALSFSLYLSDSLSLPSTSISHYLSISPTLFRHSYYNIPKAESESDVMDLSGVDVWAADFDPTSVFDKESLGEITDFFVKNAGDIDGQIR